MISISKEFIESMPVALILIDNRGEIHKINESAMSFFKNIGVSVINSIKEIDPEFHTKDLDNKDQCQWTHCINNCMININLYKVKYEDNELYYLYAYNELRYKINEMNKMLDCIDDAIATFNKDLVLENANATFTKYLEVDDTAYIGKSLNELVAEKILVNPLAPKVIAAKKTLNQKVKYKNGCVLTLTGVPIFDIKGEVNKVIITGRDITKLINLEERLKEVESEKEKYFTKLKELEEYLGANEVIYSSEEMKQALNIAIKASKTDSSIFIWGESGVGKEVMANLIHNTSNRKGKPFIAINCAALPSELLESELFGYEEGAFTGAKKQGKKGLFEEANGGTIFLDEVGELPLKMQSKLLRVIQEKGLTRVGGRQLIPIDVRYISATNLTREQLINNKQFRQDLYFRLGVIPIKILPLRKRREDIFPLVHYFLKHFNNKYNLNITLSKSVMKSLYNYDWPGNVRELKNVIERLIVLAESDFISDEEYKLISEFDIYENNKEYSEKILNNELIPLKEAYRILEINMINRALRDESNVVKAAEVLGIAPSTIYRKIKSGEINI